MKRIEAGLLRSIPGMLEPDWPYNMAQHEPFGQDTGCDDQVDRRADDRDAPDDWPAPTGPLPAMRMLQSAYSDAMRELTDRRPECAGMLLGACESDIVTHFVADEHGRATSASFTLDAAWLNRVLREFQRCGINAKGLIHSHPAGVTRPSGGDLRYVARSLGNPKNKDCSEFFLPIVCDRRLYPYVVTREEPGRVLRAELVLL